MWPKKKRLGTLTGVWVPHDTRDQIVDFVRRWSEKTEIGAGRFIGWLNITADKFYDWRERYGRVNEHNGWVLRDSWLEAHFEGDAAIELGAGRASPRICQPTADCEDV